MTVTASVQGLEAQTIFHYRIVALHNNTLEQPGADGSFMTLPLHRPRAAHPRYDEAAARRARAVCTQHDRIGARTVLDPGGLRLPRKRLDPYFLLGSRRIATTLVPLGPDCKFSGQTVFNKRPGHGQGPVTITVVAHYLGNGYLTPHKTSGQTITLG